MSACPECGSLTVYGCGARWHDSAPLAVASGCLHGWSDCPLCEGREPFRWWSCSHDGPHPDNRSTWCAWGCGSDYNRMELAAYSVWQVIATLARLQARHERFPSVHAWPPRSLASFAAESSR